MYDTDLPSSKRLLEAGARVSWASELSMAPKLCEEIWLDRDNHSSEVRAFNIYYKQTDASDPFRSNS